MLSGARIPPPGTGTPAGTATPIVPAAPASGSKCYEPGLVCDNILDYPVCQTSENPADWVRTGVHFIMGKIAPKDVAATIIPGWARSGAKGICRSALPNPQTGQFDFSFYAGYISPAQALAMYNEENFQVHQGKMDADGIKLTAAEMQSLIEGLGLSASDFACKLGQCPSQVLNPPGGDPSKAEGTYVFVMSETRIGSLIRTLEEKDAGGAYKLKLNGVTDNKRLVMLAYLHRLMELLTLAKSEGDKSRDLQKTQGEAALKAQLEATQKQLDQMKAATDAQLAAMREMAAKQITAMAIISGVTVVSSVGGILGLIWAQNKNFNRQMTFMKRQLEIAEAQMAMMRTSLELQRKAIERLEKREQPPKITDIANDLVDQERRRIAENLVEPAEAELKIVEGYEKRKKLAQEAIDKAQKELDEATIAAGTAKDAEKAAAEAKVTEARGRLDAARVAAERFCQMTPKEAAAAEYVARMEAAAPTRDAPALELLARIAEGSDPNTLVNRHNLTTDHAVAEHAAYLLAKKDARVPEALKERGGVWWETKPDLVFEMRTTESSMLAQILTRRTIPNAFLRGSSGTGKEFVVRTLAQRIARGDPTLPPELIGKSLWQVKNTAMQAGARYVGDPSARQDLFQQQMDAGNPVYVAELVKVARAGASSAGESESFASFLVEALNKDTSRMIADGKENDYDELATLGWGERRTSQTDFDRRFELLDIAQPHPSDVLKAMMIVDKTLTEEANNCVVEPAAIELAVKLGIAYRNRETSPPYNSALSALENAVGLARTEAGDPSVRVTVTPDHVIRALQARVHEPIDPTAGDHVLDPISRPHTELPYARQFQNGDAHDSDEPVRLPLDVDAARATKQAGQTPYFASRFYRVAQEKVEFLIRQAVEVFGMVPDPAREQLLVESQGQALAGFLPMSLLAQVTTQFNQTAAAPETELLPYDAMMTELATQDWFRDLHPENQQLIVLALREAARYDIVHKSGLIVDGMFTPEAVNYILEVEGFKERTLTPVKVMGAKRAAEKDEVKKERDERFDILKRHDGVHPDAVHPVAP
jgi:hypothetical protein